MSCRLGCNYSILLVRSLVHYSNKKSRFGIHSLLDYGKIQSYIYTYIEEKRISKFLMGFTTLSAKLRID